MMNADPTQEPSPSETDVADAIVAEDQIVDPELVDAELVDAELVDADHDDDAAVSDQVNAAVSDQVNDDEVLGDVSEEMVVSLIAERDEYLDALQRLKAEFSNARRRNEEQAATLRKQAAADLVDKLLPILDSCDAALGQGIDAVGPIASMLSDTLTAQGLSRLESTGKPFDPELHDAVMHEDGEGEPTVAETLRAGYLWNDKVIRPAMVKVQG